MSVEHDVLCCSLYPGAAGVNLELYADILKCVGTCPGTLLMARLTYRCGGLVGQEAVARLSQVRSGRGNLDTTFRGGLPKGMFIGVWYCTKLPWLVLCLWVQG